jgi:hypothetical protein
MVQASVPLVGRVAEAKANVAEEPKEEEAEDAEI